MKSKIFLLILLIIQTSMFFASENKQIIKTGNAELDQAIMQYENGYDDLEISHKFIKIRNLSEYNLQTMTAWYYFALCLYKGRCGDKNIKIALENFIKIYNSITQKNLDFPKIKNLSALYIGIIKKGEGLYQEALNYLKEIDLQYLTEQEIIEYNFTLAKVYYNGPKDIRNYELAFDLWKKLFYQNKDLLKRSYACIRLAEMYLFGQCLEKDLSKAKYFYEIAYNQNLDERYKFNAAFNLALIDYLNFFVNKDMNHIVKLFKEVFNQDIDKDIKLKSAFYLGEIYRSSAEFNEPEGVPGVNRQEEAKKYFEYVYNNAENNHKLKEQAEYYLDLIHGIRKVTD